jgi:FimV-like protein
VSSLQQLLALKNRVLMELQKHGIVPVGKAPQTGSAAAVSPASVPNSGASVAPGSSATVGPVVVAGNASAGPAGLSPEAMAGIAAAVAAVVALILSLTFRRRRRPSVDARDVDSVGRGASAPARDDIQAQAFPPVQPDTSAGVTGVASLAAAAELGAEALPMEQIDPAVHASEEEDGARYVGSTTRDEALKAAEAEDADLPAAPAEPEQVAAREPLPVADATDAHVAPEVRHEAPAQQVDTPAAAPEPVQATDDNVHAQPAPAEPVEPLPPFVAEFPREAVAALGGLDMALPPRTEPPAPFGEMKLDGLPPATSQPVVEPEVTARQAVTPQPSAPRAVDVFGAGTAGSAAVAGLGAMPFGALKLDFDLELPPSPAQSLPAFTQEDLSKIARNKLELAAEYIELGDLSGARTLVNEVIESNDAATRNEARALLSTLAPLS